jgi:hypothetical protein
MLTEEITHWSQVARVVYRVEQRYEYRYTEPVRSLKHCFRVVPRAVHGDQRLLDHAVAVAGTTDEPAVDWTDDAFGNPVCQVRAAHIASAVTFDVAYEVARVAHPPESALQPDDGTIDLAPFLEPTPLTMPDEVLVDVAERIRESSPPRPWPGARASARTTVISC